MPSSFASIISFKLTYRMAIEQYKLYAILLYTVRHNDINIAIYFGYCC